MSEGMSSGFTQPALGDGQTPVRSGLLADRDLLQIRFGGVGTQGVMLMGLVLATAATRDHRYVAQTETYALEECDQYGHSDVIISDHPIDYPELQAADLLVALSQDAADDHAGLLLNDGVFVYDSDRVAEPPPFNGHTYGIPFGRLACEEIGECEEAGEYEETSDLVALGAAVRITGVVSVESLRQALASPDLGAIGEAHRKALGQGLAVDPAEWRRGD